MRSLLLAVALLWLPAAMGLAEAAGQGGKASAHSSAKSPRDTEIAKKNRQMARTRAKSAANYRKGVPRKYRPKNYKAPKYKWSSKGTKRGKAPKRR